MRVCLDSSSHYGACGLSKMQVAGMVETTEGKESGGSMMNEEIIAGIIHDGKILTMRSPGHVWKLMKMNSKREFVERPPFEIEVPRRDSKQCYISIIVNGVRITGLLWRVIWVYYHGPIPPKYVIHHIDGTHSNNELSNLACVSISEHRRIHTKLYHEYWQRNAPGIRRGRNRAENPIRER